MKIPLLKLAFIPLILVLPTISLAEQEVRIMYNHAVNPPYNMADHTLELPGINIELIRKAAEGLDVKLTFIRTPWKRALAQLEESTADALMNASYNEQRAIFGRYPTKDGVTDISRRTNRQAYYLYTLKGKDPSFTDSTFAATRGYSIIGNLEAKGVTKDRLIETTGSESSLSMLISKRVDAIADLEVSMNPFMAAHKDVIRIEPELKQKEYYLVFSRGFYEKHANIANHIWDNIGTLRDSSFGKALFVKYSKQQ